MMRQRAQRTCRRPIAPSVLALGVLLAACGADSAGTETLERSVTPSTLVSTDGELEMAIERIEDAKQLFASSVGSTYVVSFEFVGQVSAEAGPVTVEVAGGVVLAESYPDATLEMVLPSIPLRTVEDMFERSLSTLVGGGAVEVTFDESYGFPTMLTIDPVPGAIDDEFSVRVISVEPGDDTLDSGDGY